jgi:hypothetical protein
VCAGVVRVIQVQCDVMRAARFLGTTCALTDWGFLGVISACHEYRNIVCLKCFLKLQSVIEGYVRFRKTRCFGSGVGICLGQCCSFYILDRSLSSYEFSF